jgi:hypothetical protein
METFNAKALSFDSAIYFPRVPGEAVAWAIREGLNSALVRSWRQARRRISKDGRQTYRFDGRSIRRSVGD